MTRQEQVDVLIVGAGPGGSTASLALDYFASKSGNAPLSILLVDKRGVSRTRANTILLDFCPAYAIEQFGCDITGFTPSTDWCQVCPEEGVFNRYPLPEYRFQARERVLFNAGFMLRRRPVFDVGINYLEDILYAQIDRRKNIQRMHSCNLADLKKTKQNTFCATLEQEGQQRKIIAKYIIVADGAKSDTLAMIGALKKGTLKLETLVSANFKQTGVGNTKYHNNNRSIEALSLATQQGTSVFVKVSGEISDEDYKLHNEEDRSKFRQILLNGARKLGIEGDIGFGFSLIPIVLERSARSIYQQNIFVIGDARHATTPRVALGANVAIMDAIRAAHAIVKIHNNPAWRAQIARINFRWHSWLGTHLLTLLGRITTTSQAIKSSSKTKEASVITRAYKFWKTQILMTFHWRASKGSSKHYRENDANALLSVARNKTSNQIESPS